MNKKKIRSPETKISMYFQMQKILFFYNKQFYNVLMMFIWCSVSIVKLIKMSIGIITYTLQYANTYYNNINRLL